MGQAASLDHQDMNNYENAVFVSYAWEAESEHIVDKLERAFSSNGIVIVRDKKDVKYKDSISEFEKRLGHGQCIVLVVSDRYLRSEHCMHELVEIDRNQGFEDRVFPIVLRNARIYTVIDRVNYIKYWEEQIELLNGEIAKFKKYSNLQTIMADLEKYDRIRSNFDKLVKFLSDTNTQTPEKHEAEDFATLINLIKGRVIEWQNIYPLDKKLLDPSDTIVHEQLDSFDSSPFIKVLMKLSGRLHQYTLPRLRNIQDILSNALGIVEGLIQILDVEVGSVILRIEMPEKAARELSFQILSRDPKIFNSLPVEEFQIEGGLSIIIPGRDSGIPKTFVGYEVHIETFRSLITNPYGNSRILLVLGGGGIGKTTLVKRMLAEAKTKDLLFCPQEPIDLFSTDYRHIDGIQWKIKDIVEELTGLRDELSPFANWVKGKTDTSENFYECLKAFCAKHPLVLAFDTFENLDQVTSDWLFKGEPYGLQVPGLICIVAGRDWEIENVDIYLANPIVQEVHVSGLTLKETETLYHRISNEFYEFAPDLISVAIRPLGLEQDDDNHKMVEEFWQLTNGNPLKLEMAFRWLPTLFLESLKGMTADKFEEGLMLQVREFAERGQLDIGGSKKVSQPVYDTLLCMAYVTRRFDEGFLQHFRDQKLIRIEDPNVTNRDIISKLEQYFFVKVRDGNSGHNFLQLHDEMARLVREYVWPYQDPSGAKKQALMAAIEKYYEQLIATPVEEEADALRIEKLYYTFQRNWKEGLRQWFKLAEEGNENINKLLPSEIKKYLSNNYYDDATLVQVHSKIAEMERNAGHIRQAVGHWERVQELGKANQREDWVVDALVGLFNCKWMAEPAQALEQYLQPAQAICEKQFPERLALIYYEIAFACRQMQDFEQAVEWYEKGLQSFQESPGEDALEGILRNDTGYAYLILGRWGDASKNLTAALEIREALWHQAERRLRASAASNKTQLLADQNQALLHVGLSRNTLGEYHRYVKELEEALKDYEQAYRHFNEINDYYWQAKCLCARGETYRRLAWHASETEREESVIQDYLDKARQDVEESLYLCEKYQLDDERDTAYRRLGRIAHDLGLMVYRQGKVKQAQEKLAEAYKHFKRGLEYAETSDDTLEELENLTELAFLADDSVVFYGGEAVPDFYYRAVDELEEGLKKHMEDPQRIYLYPVFEALWRMEKAAIALAEGDYEAALNGYVDAFVGLGTFPGYGHARYRQHFGHLTQQIESLPRDEQVRWCKEFIDVWKNTKMPGRRDKTLADDLLPDLVKWCNRLLHSTV